MKVTHLEIEIFVTPQGFTFVLFVFFFCLSKENNALFVLFLFCWFSPLKSYLSEFSTQSHFRSVHVTFKTGVGYLLISAGHSSAFFYGRGHSKITEHNNQFIDCDLNTICGPVGHSFIQFKNSLDIVEISPYAGYLLIFADSPYRL